VTLPTFHPNVVERLIMNRFGPRPIRRIASAALVLGAGLAFTACFPSSSETQDDCETVKELILDGQEQVMKQVRDPAVTTQDLSDALHGYTDTLRAGAEDISNEALKEAVTSAADKLEADMEGVLQGGRPDYTVMAEFAQVVAQECQGQA
jgi:hypothetical protein